MTRRPSSEPAGLLFLHFHGASVVAAGAILTFLTIGCATTPPTQTGGADTPRPLEATAEDGGRQKEEALIGAWSFEEDAGDRVRDGSRNGHHGTMRNARRVPGAIGRALRFTGENSGVDIPDAEGFHIGSSFTIEAWIRPEALPPNAIGHDHGLVFFRGDSRKGMDPYRLTVWSDGTLRFSVVSAEDRDIELKHPILLDTFSHVVGVLDVASKKAQLYLNGELVSEASTEVRPLVDLDPGAAPGVGIGHHAGRDWWDYGFLGVIDEVRLYGRTLSAAEIGARAKAR
jgi:hypothetical protein